MSTYYVEVGTMDVRAVRNALFVLGPNTGVHLGSIAAYASGRTVIQHWCDPEAARVTAQRLTEAGFPARSEVNPDA